MLLSRGERKDTGKARQYIMANAVEALIGAIFLDSGYANAEKFVHSFIIVKLPEIVERGLHIDTKSRFQELAQEKHRITPVYRVLSETGLDHAKEFTVGAFLENKKVGEGVGTSKQEAQQNAAKQALIFLESSN